MNELLTALLFPLFGDRSRFFACALHGVTTSFNSTRWTCNCKGYSASLMEMEVVPAASNEFKKNFNLWPECGTEALK